MTASVGDSRELARLIVDSVGRKPELILGSNDSRVNTEPEQVNTMIETNSQTPLSEPDAPVTEHDSFASALDTDDPEVITHRLEDLPKELGVLLASVGVLGIILPGIAGAPALIAGGLVLWPKTFGRVEDWFQGRFPFAHRKSMQQVGRFLDDMDRRYPLLPDDNTSMN